ncbi:2',3'-cyclic-nucleotide 2'-phosphodiesterase/5'-or 3'-nucleotidase, 5'-nucleotidase family [Halobiforma haloterrestris]|uniref:2',3'-cyclic-nucleotide 2'-phosphodiesterase/5'-or 3'-nucleotidase, 5'-nucleotidase family n=1 Tax=Natronobacterium haloterrestre TaxID=148448 RepID=A0A1I1DH71_NATHA|nr:5'-nucleotidase C-terminal domain-containing protein [Halobiforma haloterrestris]SFB73766.1 2',3'-cyclic-nucleotide 2'-phosphodiesterase/5'-or 3'-nucleotidase, 5'-nucleotidase family [Halobiforma haloterrestris]
MDLDTAYLGAWTGLDGSTAEGGEGPNEPDVSCLHVSDLHGQLVPEYHVYYDNPESRPDFEFGDDDRLLRRGGGIPLLTAKLEEIRAAADGTLTLMSGDTFHGAAETTYTNGRAMLEPINDHLRPDVYVPGNWDFGNEGAEDGNLRELMDALEARVLANNLFEPDDDELLFDPYTVERVGGIEIGVVGMTNVYVDRMAPAFHEGKYRFGKHPTLLEEAARDARDAGADVVLAVTEIGLPWAVQAAKDLEGIDVLFSAHTHEYTHDPIVIEETGTVVVESGTGDGLGRVDLRYDGDGVAVRHVLYCLAEGHEYTPDPEPAAERTVETIRDPFFDAEVSDERGDGTLERPLDTVVGETETPLDRQSFLESGWNLLFGDALRSYFGTDLAVTHGFRYGPAVPAGEITLEHLYRAFPMTGPVARGGAYGQQLLNHMEAFLTDNFTPYVYEQEDGRVRNYSSNVEVVVDPTAKRERRLVDLIVDGESVDPEAKYSVATFTRPGDPERDLGNCGFPFSDVHVEDGVVPVDVVADYLEDHSPIDYGATDPVRTPDDGGRVQNTPADGPYPYVQPGVDYADGEAYAETRLIPTGSVFPDGSHNRYR